MLPAVACSGAMYAGVPTVVPVAVRLGPPASESAFAMPKSAIFTSPSAVTIRFSGLMSRWTMPRRSASARPASAPSSTPIVWASVVCPTKGRSDPRARYSIAMYGVPLSLRNSNTVTMFGCCIDPATRDSRTNRSANAGSAAWKEFSSFRATSRSRSICRAR